MTVHRHQLGPEHAQLQDVERDARLHQPDVLAGVEGALGEPDVGDDALVGVVVGVEDEALERRVRVALGRRHPLHDGLQHQVDVGALLGRHEDDLLARDGEHVLQLLA